MRRFQSAALAAVAVVGFVSVASAADMPIKSPSASALVYTWTGLYVGMVGGGGWGTTNQNTPFGESSGSFNTSGGLAGATLGYNWQRGAFILGIEGDFSWGNIRGSTITDECTPPCTTELHTLGTIRGRLGYAAGQFMPYVTGGYAFGDLRRGFGTAFGSVTADGWVFGGGVEGMFAPSWSAKLEYLYVDLGTTNVPISGFPTNVDFWSHVLRIGLNYKFSTL